MTLLQSRELVLTSMAQELQGRLDALNANLQKGWLRSSDAGVLAQEVDALEGLMGYVHAERERLRADRIREVVCEVDSVLKGSVQRG